jgi:hypothetical protein
MFQKPKSRSGFQPLSGVQLPPHRWNELETISVGYSAFEEKRQDAASTFHKVEAASSRFQEFSYLHTVGTNSKLCQWDILLLKKSGWKPLLPCQRTA